MIQLLSEHDIIKALSQAIRHITIRSACVQRMVESVILLSGSYFVGPNLV